MADTIKIEEIVYDVVVDGNDLTIVEETVTTVNPDASVEIPANLAAIADVVITSPTDGDAIIYDADNEIWINGVIESSSVEKLADLTDVSITTPVNRSMLLYDTSDNLWKDNTLEIGELGDVYIDDRLADKDVISWDEFNFCFTNKNITELLTISTGLTDAAGTITVDLSTGKSGGQSVIGGTAAGDDLTLVSTSNATKGNIFFGTSTYDEVNNRLGIGITSPTAVLDIRGMSDQLIYVKRDVFDFVQYWRVTSGVWTDITVEAGRSKGTVSGDILDIVGDFFYVGKTNKFSSIYIDIGTGRSATATSSFEYSLGNDTWYPLTITTDGTVNLTVDGAIVFTPPADWATDSQNGSAQLFMVRIGTVSGTFTTEPTIYLAVPNAGQNILEIFANGNDTNATFKIDAAGNVRLGESGTTVTSGGSFSTAGITCTTISSSSTITDTLTTTGFTHVGGLILNGPVATALIQNQNSPVARFSGQAWNGTITKVNAMDIYLNPNANTATAGRLAFKNTTVDGVADAAELMNLTTDGNLNLLGKTYGTEIFSNPGMSPQTPWVSTGDWAYSTNDFTFTYSTGAGTIYQPAGNFANPLKPNTWYRFRYTVGVAAPSTTVVWIGEEVADSKTYFSGSTTEIDVFFKTNDAPGDFVIYTTATATSGFRIDDVSLMEVYGGVFSATTSVIKNIIGGNAASENLTLSSTSHATKGTIITDSDIEIALGKKLIFKIS